MDFNRNEYIYLLNLVEEEKRKHELIHIANDTLSFLNSVIFKLQTHIQDIQNT